ncbi:hypothetical protein PV797_14730 [Clostridiaceae bacterium M8S5]|nr:hypothetical protein PV797_14730 [Clostridiaceae bacterium M8S5]
MDDDNSKNNKRVLIFIAILIPILILRKCCASEEVLFPKKVDYDQASYYIFDSHGNIATYLSENKLIKVEYINNDRYKVIIKGEDDIICARHSGFRVGMVKDKFIDLIFDEKESKSIKYILLAIFCFIMGILLVTCTETMIYLSRGWMYKDAEPSDEYIAFNKGFGWILMIGCAIYFVI